MDSDHQPPSPPPPPPAQAPLADPYPFDDYYIDSTSSTPFVSAPSSPRHPNSTSSPTISSSGFYYSAPASPMHFVLSSSSRYASSSIPSSPSSCTTTTATISSTFEFNRAGPEEIGFADELFLNGQIRPMKLATHLLRPQTLAEVSETNEVDDEECGEGGDRGAREIRLRDRSMRRRTRSLSPLRSTASFDWGELGVKQDGDEILVLKKEIEKVKENNGEGAGVEEVVSNETTPSASGSSSRCSSAGRSSKRWVFLKDFLRSKSEGRNNVKFWASISFSPTKEKEKKSMAAASSDSREKVSPVLDGQKGKSKKESGKKAAVAGLGPGPVNGVGKRRVPASVHEVHYAAYRAQAEEMRKKTYLPYRQGLLGCLGFSSKSYGAMNGFARALNPVSSR
ncbi:hypothetical protein Droror1_Dr00001900 [Drosera rotundifolia]